MQNVLYRSPVGVLRLEAADEALKAIYFEDDESAASTETESVFLSRAIQQLEEYFSGKRTEFELPLAPEGTAFQQSVWCLLRQIPYGKTTSYIKLATMLGDVKKVRAVGNANAQNPIPIIIPCHRVIGVNNHLIGYSGGIARKRFLLQHEGAILL